MSKSNLESLERDLMNEAMGDGGGGGGGGDDDAEWGI